MLTAAFVFRPLLSRSRLATQHFSFSWVTTNSLKLRPVNPLWKLQGSRCIMDEPGKEVSSSVEAALKSRDSIPKNFRIIYRAPHEYYVKVTYMTAVVAITSIPVLMAAVYLTGNHKSYPMKLLDLTLFETSTDAYLLLGLLALTVVNIANTVAKYPMRIYRNPLENNYIAVFQHPIPGIVKRVEFTAGEVQKSEGWIWKDSTYAIKKKKKVLLVPEHFSTPIELERMTIAPHEDSPVEKQKRRSRMV